MASLDPSSSTHQRARGDEINVATEEEDPLPQLPFKLLLNIVQRADAVTVVRCAATQKLLRGAILSPAFRPWLGVDPALLLGFSFWEQGRRRSIDTPPLPTGGGGGSQPRVHLDDDAIVGFKSVAWRDGLLLIERHLGRDMYDLRVCNALTGDVTASLPPISLPVKPPGSLCNMHWPRPCSHTFVFLTAGGRSFELVAANIGLQTQVFSSDRWEWGTVRDTTFPQYQHLRYLPYDAFSRPAIIGRTIYWLCSRPPVGEPVALVQRGAGYLEPEILSLDVDAAEAAVRKVPRDCFSEMVSRQGCFFDTRALLTSVRRKPCLFILERNGMSAWTPSDDPESRTWSMQFMLTRPELEARAALDPHGFPQLRLHAYGERSGAVIVEVTPRVFLRLDIGEGFDLVRVGRLGSQESEPRNITVLCLHETDLVSLLQSMKSFLP